MFLTSFLIIYNAHLILFCVEFDRTSHCFRNLIISNLEQMTELTINKILPPPKRVAQELRELTVRILHQWNTSFGKQYIRLDMVYNYLRNTEKVS